MGLFGPGVQAAAGRGKLPRTMLHGLELEALRPLPRGFYDRDVVQVARDLLGKCLVRTTTEGTVVGRIVEAEAYLARDDPASHSFRGRTRRNASMFGPPGHAYVYAIHSRWCVNVVTEPKGVASAVLLRAAQPLGGVELMRQRRRTARRPGAIVALRDLARGPARLCEAFGIDRRLDGWDLTQPGPLWVASMADDADCELEIVATPRIGVTAAHELPLRFCLAGNPYVSKPGSYSASGAPTMRRSLRAAQSGETAASAQQRKSRRTRGSDEGKRRGA